MIRCRKIQYKRVMGSLDSDVETKNLNNNRKRSIEIGEKALNPTPRKRIRIRT